MTDIKKHPSYIYAEKVVKGKVIAPKYVILQCVEFIKIANGEDEKYKINEKRVSKIDKILKLLVMAKGLDAGKNIYKCLKGFQFLLIVASLCVVYRDNPKKRRYETVILEIARKNGKTFLVAVLFILLFFIEPKYSYFYSVAPDGSLSREIKKAIEEIIGSNPSILTVEGADKLFKIRRDDIICYATESKYIPLNYSNSRLDGKLPNVFLVDEVGALPNSYAIEAMRSGQLTILNKLGFVISTKYPTANNPFEDEITYAKSIFDKKIEDEKVFALLYEPDNTKDWATDDNILIHSNPLAIEIPEMWQDLLDKRQRAIEVESARENFLTKHCNIIYQGIGTETYIPIETVKRCKTDNIDWSGRQVYLGLDLSMTGDNTSVSMVSLDYDEETILAESFCFVPDGRIDEKNKFEHLDYRRFIQNEGKCFACGDLVIDYGYIENFIKNIEEKFNVEVVSIGYDRYNAISSAQKLEAEGFTTVEVKQHSSVLHAPTKLLKEKITEGKFKYTKNTLLEINFENAKCTYDTNLNLFVNKKKSNGKVDLVISMLNAIYLLQQDIIFNDDFVCDSI